jgi:hypothetical protein
MSDECAPRPPIRVHAERRLLCHDSAWEEQRRRLAEDRGDFSLELRHDPTGAVSVDLGCGIDRGEKRRRRPWPVTNQEAGTGIP